MHDYIGHHYLTQAAHAHAQRTVDAARIARNAAARLTHLRKRSLLRRILSVLW